MSRIGATISDHDTKVLDKLSKPFQWYTPSAQPLPKFEDQQGAQIFESQRQSFQQEQQQQKQQQEQQQQQKQQQEKQFQLQQIQLPQGILYQQPLAFQELPVFVEVGSGFEGGKLYQEEKLMQGKRIPIVDYTEPPHQISFHNGNLNEWKNEARNCIDKILQLNNKAYNRINQFENFKFVEGGLSFQKDAENWTYKLRRNLDNLVKENEKLRAELDSSSFGKYGVIQRVNDTTQGVRGGVNMEQRTSNAIDSSHVLKPSEIKKSHYQGEKLGQWHPQAEKQTLTEKVKDAAVGIANTVEQVALHPIQSVEKAADAVVHTII